MNRLAIVATLAVFATSAHALEFSNNYCDPSTGDIGVVVKARAWDAYYHGTVIIKARDSYMNWKEVKFNMAYPKGTYGANAYQMGLSNVQQYNIATGKTTLLVSACGK
ncbi:hypothetical protein HUU51_03710 [Candidatus Gracilibacteria bacterium]|nr:hypothetical protein [Candidatus Gracilibacteria bacterium]